MLKNTFIFLIFLFGELIKNIFSEIRIPFGIIHKINNDSIPLITKILQNKIYTNLSLGTPPQIIKSYLKINFELFHLPSKLINTTNSKTMKCTTDVELSIGFEDVLSGYYCTDIIYFNNIEKRVDFILNGERGDIYGSIGLLIPQDVDPDMYPFFQSLKENEVINSYTWTLKYFNNISLIDTINGDKAIGELIFGDEPYNYENNKNLYPVDNYHTVPTIIPADDSEDFIFWELEFNDVFLNLKNGTIFDFGGTKKAEIKPDVNYLVGPLEYFNVLNKTFFKKYYDENICKDESIGTFSGYISCDKEKFNFNDFPVLSFEHKKLENKFNLTGSDLFVLDPKTNKYIFLIFIYKIQLELWRLGSPFLKKYQFVFNEDAKTIGYYVPNITNSEEGKEEKTNMNYIILICVLILIIIVIFIGAAILFKKGIIQFPRKRRANELEEDILYEEKGGNSNKNSDVIDTINS